MNDEYIALPDLLTRTVERLAALQYQADGPDHVRGEFPMRLTGPISRVDHNYLSGYTLLHVTLAVSQPGLPAALRARLAAILETAAEVPARYQSPRLTGNWYSGHGSGLPAPVDYPWPEGRVLCLHDDYDDTAISALLAALGPFRLRAPLTPALFAAAAYDPARQALVPKSMRRLELTGIDRDVYLSWVLPESGGEPPDNGELIWLPPANSVELTTVANVYAAVHVLGGDADAPAQRASRAFVNAMAAIAIEQLLKGDASYLDFASSYYPRVPFAPLAFLVHNHILTGGALLDAGVLALLLRAVAEVDPHSGWRMHGFANPVYWLNCAAWCLAGGLIDRERIAAPLAATWDAVRGAIGDDGAWPDIIFFHAAHLGDYGGTAYVQALMAETLALLGEAGLA